MRIVSLIASATEIVCALGFEKELIGRSHECDYPAGVLKLPECSATKVNVKADSSTIDRQVKEIVRDSLSVYSVDAALLKKLNPDVIVTQDHCEVCAVSLKDVENAVCQWLGNQPRIVSLKPDSLSDVWAGINDIAEALAEPERGRRLVSKLQGRMLDVQKKVQPSWNKPTVACIEWFEPLMAAGNWIPEMVTMLGAQDVFGQPGKHAPWLTWEDLKRRDPDVIITMPCGWDIERSRQEFSALSQNPVWAKLKAVQAGRVFLADGNQFFNRPGPRLAESLEILAEILYPAYFSFGHAQKAWQTP